MSNYYKQTVHPKTDKWENALWIDNHFGPYQYGVQFPSEPNVTYDPLAMGTRLRTHITQYEGEILNKHS